jgi:EAL domain-containing protein (putative c-di-GMP-specific phosphodiesterase class I)
LSYCTKQKTVAEFVSKDTIYAKIHSLGIDLAQGFYFGKPIPLEEVE